MPTDGGYEFVATSKFDLVLAGLVVEPFPPGALPAYFAEWDRRGLEAFDEEEAEKETALRNTSGDPGAVPV